MINTITTIRMPDGTTVAFEDWSDKPLYATVDLVHGFTREKIDFLGYAEGESVPTASPAPGNIPRESTIRDTNMQAPGSMASTEERMIYAMKPEYFMLTVDDPDGGPFDMNTMAARSGSGEPIPNPVALAILGRSLLFTLKISQKDFAQAGLLYFNTGFGPFAGASTMAPAAAAGRTYGSAGIPSQEAVRSYVVPQYAGGTEKLQAFLSNPTGEPVNFGLSENGAVEDNPFAVMSIRMNFEGLYKRPVS